MMNQREYYRVEYPVLARPVLTAIASEYEVLDVSEYGMRFSCAGESCFRTGMFLLARIRFNDGREYDCHGKILRCDDASVSMQLHNPIPLKRIHSETARLQASYRQRFLAAEQA